MATYFFHHDPHTYFEKLEVRVPAWLSSLQPYAGPAVLVALVAIAAAATYYWGGDPMVPVDPAFVGLVAF